MKAKIDIMEAILQTAQRHHHDGIDVGVSGNISFFDRQQNMLYITASSIAYEDLKIEDISVLHEGKLIHGKIPSSELPMHQAIYHLKENVHAIVHTHSTYASVYACLNETIQADHLETAIFVGEQILVSPFCEPGTRSLGEEAVSYLHDAKACLLEKHGVLATGKTLTEAYYAALYTEHAAQMKYLIEKR